MGNEHQNMELTNKVSVNGQVLIEDQLYRLEGEEDESDATDTPSQETEEGEDAFDKLIQKTYDKDCGQFFQRLDKLKRLNSVGNLSHQSKSSVSVATAKHAQNLQSLRPLGSRTGSVTPNTGDLRIQSKINLNRHVHSFS